MKNHNKLTILLITIISAIMILLSGCGSSSPTSANNAGGGTGGGTTPPVTGGPVAPTGVAATASGTTQININWTLNASASSYNIYRSATSGFIISPATKIASAAAGPFGNTGLIPATTYYYKVTAVNATGESAPSVEVVATTQAPPGVPTPPAVPTGVTATVISSSQINIDWILSASATSYNIYRSTTPGFTISPATKIASAAAGPFGNTGLTPATTYFYQITAVNVNGESAPSVEIMPTTQPLPIPAAPTGVSAVVAASNQININWNNSAGATSYNVYRSTTPGFTVSLATKIGSAAAGPFGDNAVAQSMTYYYKVTALNAVNSEGPPSAEVNQLILLSPSAVTGVEGSNINLLSWNAVSGITSYNIYWSTVPGVTKATGTKIPVNGYSYQHMGLTNGINYYYVVTAVDAAGHESPESTEIAFKPELGYTWTPRFSLPAVLTAIAYSGTKFVAVGRNGSVAITTDGNIWTSYNSGVTSDFRAITWAGTQFVAVTGSSTVVPVTPANPGGMLYTTDIVTSPDGITWTIRYSASSIYSNWLNSVAWSGTQLVAVGQSGSLVSPDGITWSAGSAMNFGLFRVVWAGNQFFATGGQMYRSVDGITWALVTIDPTFSPSAVTWSGTQYVAVGIGNGIGATTTIYTSPDSITWTPRSSLNISPHSILWTGKVFVVHGYDIATFVTSTDGVTWTPRTWGSLTTNGVIGDMAASNNVIIGLSGGFCLTSP